VAHKPILILAGKIDHGSFLQNEFFLQEIFSLRIGENSYRELLEILVDSIKDQFKIQWNDTDSLSDLKKANFNNDQVVIFDVHQFVRENEYFEKKIRGLRPAKLSELKFEKSECLDFRNTAQLFSFLLLKSPHRNFNEFNIQNGFVIKKCTFESKGQREFNFLKNIPESVSEYFPRVRNYSEGPGWQQYEVEMINTFDFGRIAMHAKMNLQIFKNLLSKIEEFAAASPRVKVSPRRYKQHLESLFIEKLRLRYEELTQSPEGQKLAKEISLETKMNELTELLKNKIEMIKENELLICHGDMCFSNILYGVQSNSLKFIDPRGVTKEEEIYGPWYYDLAKLSHSVFGQYDLIINDVKPHKDLDQLFNSMRSYFKSWVTGHDWDFEFLRLCEASLFFSMLPFHIGKPNHAKLQFQSGLNALESAKSIRK
jgi:hypothetical protein